MEPGPKIPCMHCNSMSHRSWDCRVPRGVAKRYKYNVVLTDAELAKRRAKDDAFFTKQRELARIQQYGERAMRVREEYARKYDRVPFAPEAVATASVTSGIAVSGAVVDGSSVGKVFECLYDNCKRTSNETSRQFIHMIVEHKTPYYDEQAEQVIDLETLQGRPYIAFLNGDSSTNILYVTAVQTEVHFIMYACIPHHPRNLKFRVKMLYNRELPSGFTPSLDATAPICSFGIGLASIIRANDSISFSISTVNRHFKRQGSLRFTMEVLEEVLESPLLVALELDGASSNDQGTAQSQTCYNCGELGHMCRDCPSPKNDRKGNGCGGSD
ncbi:unnamed protein product [Orchesella dallaii]|uniref:CCHC-type domain-containing protein n=1 Tax=Orchesella dallaii TaxID=48710 RepID=A0ABP1RWE2_9HEXA